MLQVIEMIVAGSKKNRMEDSNKMWDIGCVHELEIWGDRGGFQ